MKELPVLLHKTDGAAGPPGQGTRSRTRRSIAQPGPPCEEDPASPVLFTLIISHLRIAPAILK